MTASTASESVDAGSRRARAVGRDMVVRGRWWSARLDARPIVVTAALALGLVAVASLSISLGDFPIPLREVIATLFGGGDDEAVFVVGTLRLPRVITGSLVGLALGMSGAMFQSLLRNPLASPDVIGFNSGAALGAVMVIVTWGGSSAQIALGAIAGGLGAAFAVYALAWRRGVGVYRLVLVGIGIGFTINAVVQYLLTRASINDVQRAAVWLTGSLNGRTWSHAGSITTALVVLVPIALGLQRRLDLLALGDDTAAALGVEMNRTKLALIVVAVCLAASGVAAAGPIGFIAFISPAIARRLARSPSASLLASGLVGALLTLLADLAGRRVIAPTELPVGVFTALFGAPYLLWLLVRGARSGAL